MLIIKDKINDILSKSQRDITKRQKSTKSSTELDKASTPKLMVYITELNDILNEYQIFVNTEYAHGLEDSRTLDYNSKPPLNPITNQTCLWSSAYHASKKSGSRQSSRVDVIQVVDPIYDNHTSLYDQNLPKDSEAVAFAKKKLDEKAPWQCNSRIIRCTKQLAKTVRR